MDALESQKWTLGRDGSGRTIVTLNGKCLDIRNASHDEGAVVQIYDCANVPQQAWTMSPDFLIPPR